MIFRMRVEVVGRPDIGLITETDYRGAPQWAQREWEYFLHTVQRQLIHAARTNQNLQRVPLCVTECAGPDGKLRRARNGSVMYASGIVGEEIVGLVFGA